MNTSKAPTGQRIVLEIVKEMQDRLYPLFYRTLAPSLYHVYLHPDDYREIEGVTSLIALDAQKALNARVTRLNRRSRWSALLSDTSSVEAPPNGWEIHIHPEANGELDRGELGIVSRLSVPVAPHYTAGTPTARIVRTVITSTARRSVATDEAAPPPIPASPVPDPGVHLSSATNRHRSQGGQGDLGVNSAPELLDLPVSSSTELSSGARVALPHASHATLTEKPVATLTPDADSVKGFARLAYLDEQGPHEYTMKKDVVSIGRGGREHWVDIQLVTTARVSREHCRIRRDDQGRFFLHDLSTWGTSVDGKPARPLGNPDGAPQNGAAEQELPPQARIQLADAVVIDFQVQPLA